MAGTFSLSIVSPEGDILKENVEFVVLPSGSGELGILPNHAPLIAGMDVGVVRYTLNNSIKRAALTGGFVEVIENSVIVLADTAVLSENVDVARAIEARERAKKRLAARNDEMDVRRAELSLRRATARIDAAEGKK